MRKLVLALGLIAGLSAAQTASASSIAVFGDNGIDDFLNSSGHTATLVSDAQLATVGFLNGFDLLIYTRDGSGFGSGLSAGAAAQVSAWVTGNAVNLIGDYADNVLDDANVQTLFLNSVSFAATTGHGFIGEFNGAAAAMSSNANGFAPLNIFAGSANGLSGNGGGSNLAVVTVAASPVLAGLPGSFDPNNLEFGFTASGVNSSQVVARYGATTGNPAILVRGSAATPVPEPTTLVLLGSGLVGAYRARRRK